MNKKETKPQAKRLLLVIEHHKMTLVQFRKHFNIGSQVWDGWRTRNIPSNKIIPISEFFDISPKWLQFGNEQDKPIWLDNEELTTGKIEIVAHKAQQIATKVPLLTMAQAAQYCQQQNHDIFNRVNEWQATTSKISINGFALRIPNTLSQPTHPTSKSTVYFIEPNREPENGDVVAAYQQGSQEASLKILIIDGAHKLLKSLNPEIPNQILDDTYTICGVAIESQQHL